MSVESSPPPRGRGRAYGKYVLDVRLGSGGMGEVWKAWDGEIGRWVALKFLRDGGPDEEARLRREAQVAGRLSHPNIASVYESDGRCIAMQYIDGPTLADAPRHDARLLVRLVRDAALAVHAAHEIGFIHRDLKPANLMVQDGRVYVMDFGLAKQTASDSSLTMDGYVLGTPHYMAREQALGLNDAVDARSDVHALGATLYELLSGRPPFDGASTYEVLHRVVEEEAPPLHGVDRELGAVVMKCLEKDAARRYPTARALAEDLARWLEGEPVTARAAGTTRRLRRFVARRWAVLAAAAALFLAGYLGALRAVHDCRECSTTPGHQATKKELPARTAPLGRGGP